LISLCRDYAGVYIGGKKAVSGSWFWADGNSWGYEGWGASIGSGTRVAIKKNNGERYWTAEDKDTELPAMCASSSCPG
jgi:hypothetical protein